MNEGPGNKEALLYRDLKPLSAAFKMITTVIKKDTWILSLYFKVVEMSDHTHLLCNLKGRVFFLKQ